MNMHSGGTRWSTVKSEEGAEVIHQGEIDIRVLDDGDGLPRAVRARPIERTEVVLCVVVLRRYDQVISQGRSAVGNGPLRLGLMGLGIIAGFAQRAARPAEWEVVQRDEAGEHRRQRR